MIKKANAQVIDPVISISDWQKIHGSKTFTGSKQASDTILDLKQHSRYLLSHCTIMASVMTEESPNDYLIKPETAQFVNSNHDSWENELLRQTYHGFRGAFCFEEHSQRRDEAKGHILDAVLRKVMVAPPDIWVYLVDILVATDLAHTRLINRIKSGDLNAMSMGCVTQFVTCSFCGKRVDDNTEPCSHLRFQKGTLINDEDGVPRIVSEICGHRSDPDSVKFIEASWVKVPACTLALLRSTVSEEWIGPKTPYTAAIEKRANKVAGKRNFHSLNLELSRSKAEMRGF